ncbi:MAG: quinolinate synthase NadA [bacterium]|nr:quinolinate synthase NadA [bacterium]
MKQDLIERIEKLKKKRDVIILAHNYQLPEVQDIADFVGDSLDLSRKAANTTASVIVFCGVQFMAETAKILSPEKTVLLPDLRAGCPLADMVTPEKLRQRKEENPDATVICYINSSAEVKAESDICCTSANAQKVVESVPNNREIIFIPDKWLGNYVLNRTNRKLILWNGHCPTHLMISRENILLLKERHPDAHVLVHPECTRSVVDIATHTLSTNGMVDYVKRSKARDFIIGTEVGILHRLKKENPEKRFYPASVLAECPNMKLINLEKILWSLENMKYEIEISEEIRIRAKEAVSKMLEINNERGKDYFNQY